MFYTTTLITDEQALERFVWLSENPEAVQRFLDCINYELYLTERASVRGAKTPEEVWRAQGAIDALDRIHAFPGWLKLRIDAIRERNEREEKNGVS